MSEDDESESNRSSSGNWLRQIGMSLAGPPRDRDELVAVLTEAQENELLDVDALWMMQGVLKVSELQVRDIMIPRSQMVVVESCLLYTSPSPRDLSTSRMPSSA